MKAPPYFEDDGADKSLWRGRDKEDGMGKAWQ